MIASARIVRLVAAILTTLAMASLPASNSLGSTSSVAHAGPSAQLSGRITLDGSSTVFPISEAMAEEFQKVAPGVQVTVGISGTGGGFKRFCVGETDISDASRPISKSESDICLANGIQYVELPVAFDGIAVMVSPLNSFVETMTVAELKAMWEPAAQGTVTRWSQIRPDWPDRPFKLYGPGADSGTFDYFTAEINGRERDSRGDYTGSEDDNVLVQGIANDPDALGYFGYAYYVHNTDKLKLVGIDDGSGRGPVYPSPDTIANGSYQPLSRPIFIYPKASSLDRPEVLEFVRFYLTPGVATEIVPQVGYIAFPPEVYQAGLQRLENRQVGSVFPGRVAKGVTVNDLYGRAPAFP